MMSDTLLISTRKGLFTVARKAREKFGWLLDGSQPASRRN